MRCRARSRPHSGKSRSDYGRISRERRRLTIEVGLSMPPCRYAAYAHCLLACRKLNEHPFTPDVHRCVAVYFSLGPYPRLLRVFFEDASGLFSALVLCTLGSKLWFQHSGRLPLAERFPSLGPVFRSINRLGPFPSDVPYAAASAPCATTLRRVWTLSERAKRA